MLHLIAIILLMIFILAGILMVPLSLPGTWVIALVGLIYALFYPFENGDVSTLWVIGWLVGVATFGEIVEFVVGNMGGKVVKVSNGAIIAAFIGSILGLFIGVPIFLIGSLIGMFIGAFLGALIYELLVLKSVGRALVTACTVLATRVVALGLKTMLAIGMSVYLLWKVF